MIFKKKKPKVVVIGADGMDARLLEEFMDAGLMPNLEKLRTGGTYSRLGTTYPATSPVAWSTFITGKNPGKHRVYDFLCRDPKTYLPKIPLCEVEETTFGKPRISLYRRGGSFYQEFGANKVSSTLIQIPVTFPPDKIRGRMLSGLGVPDIVGSNGTYTFFSSRSELAEDTEMGGRVKIIDLADGKAASSLDGPKGTTVPVGFELSGDSVSISLDGKEAALGLNEWSDWFEVTFHINKIIPARGICRFWIKSLRPELEIYCSAVNFNPVKPPYPISYPKNYSAKLKKNTGMYKTLGWAIDTWAYNEDVLDEKSFMEDLNYTFGRRIDIALDELKNCRDDFFMAVFQATDRVAHMFWCDRDPQHQFYNEERKRKNDHILEVYQRMDDVVGEVLNLIDNDTTLIFLSDHGFNSFRQGVNINTWLMENGYLVYEGGGSADREMRMRDLQEGRKFWQNVNWRKSRAYSLGLGQIFINLSGREAQGIVNPGKEYQALRDEIIDKFQEIRDPADGARVVRRVYKAEEIYSGIYFGEAPDLLVGFEDGYRVSWQTSLGGAPPGIIAPNDRRWSGDHCSFDPEITPAVLLSNKCFIIEDQPEIADITATILNMYDVEIPSDIDGKPLRVKD